MRLRRLPISRYVKSIATQFVSVEMPNIPASEQSHQAKVAYFFESWVLYVEEWCGCKMAGRHVGLPNHGRD